MEQSSLDEWVAPPVDPETRAHIYSLVNAVGGPSIEHEGRYIPGDDAFACLRDLRRWIKYYYVEMGHRLDSVRCIAESNLVKNDLLEILALWTEDQSKNPLRAKLASACLELLVPLTWPVEIEDHMMRMSHHRHLPYVRLAQVGYKRAILQHDSGRILRTVVRVAIHSLAEERSERTPKDEGIIRLLLYFFRNLTLLSHPPELPTEKDEGEISRSATVEAFKSQDIFQLLLTMGSTMGEDFSQYDVIILEILFHILKGVDAKKLFIEEKELSSTNSHELKDLLQKEKAMNAGYARYAPSRHNRFGTMVWVKKEDDKVSTVTGQEALNNQRSLLKMDKTKKWNKPKHRGRKAEEEEPQNEFDKTIPLTSSARKHLRSFVEDFLDSSFNPLFTHLRKTIEREAERVLRVHSMQYFYLVSWFLHAECSRRQQAKENANESGSQAAKATAEEESFALIAGAMTQETFILLNRSMQRSLDDKEWLELSAEMRCFTQILLTVQEMADSKVDDDQEIAENIQNRIFYEESTHDRIITILRTYKEQGFGYLNSSTELSHVFLRMLEKYSKQNVDLQVRSRRRARKRRKAETLEGEEGAPYNNHSEAEDEVQAHRTTTERKFDFAKFSAKFFTQGCIDSFVRFTRYYNDLNSEQLKRAHRFFYRAAFKLELGVMLYRADIFMLFNKMIKGPDPLNKHLPSFREWEELVKNIFKRAIRKIEERPELIVEMLFSKMPVTAYYLEHGYDKEVVTRAPRAPAELEVMSGMEKSDQIGVAVGVLINQNKFDALRWIKDVLTSAIEERESWRAAEEARKSTAELPPPEGEDALIPVAEDEDRKPPLIIVRPDSPHRKTAMFKDNKLRLLMTLLGFERLGLNDDSEASWIISSDLDLAVIKAGFKDVQKHEFSPPIYDDGKSPQDFIRTKTAAARQRRAEYDDDSSGSDANGNDNWEFAVGGPTVRKAGAEKPKKKLHRRELQEIDDEEKDRRAEARREKDKEKRAKIKSTLYVHDSDDETDEERDKEFFAHEDEIRKKAGRQILKEMAKARINDVIPRKGKRKSAVGKETKRKRSSVNESISDLSDNEMEGLTVPAFKKKHKSIFSESEDRDESDDGPLVISSREPSEEASDVDGGASEEDEFGPNAINIPLSSQTLPRGSSVEVSSPKTMPADVIMVEEDGDEDEDVPVAKSTKRSNVRAGFIIDSDSE